jgi:hypothetical protein
MKPGRTPHRDRDRGRVPIWPIRLPRRSKVTAIQCGYCRQWLKPRYIRWPAAICRSCEHAGLNQTWTPSAAHLARARLDADNRRPGHHLTNQPPRLPDGGNHP